MLEDQGDHKTLADALDRFSRKADEILRAGSNNTARIEVNAGGAGVWIASTACMVMLAASLIGAIFVTREFLRQDSQLRELRDKDAIHDAWIQTINNNKQDKQR